MLEILELSYCIKTNSILNQLSLSVEDGHYFALAGENGAGKSTLIKIILDLINHDVQGTIQIQGQDKSLPSSREILTYLPEKFDVKKDVTGWQYLSFVFGVYRQPVDKNLVAQLCDQMAFNYDVLSNRTGTYSKGMKQKLGLISCFMLQKQLVILDEPLSGLDPNARYHFKQLLLSEREQNRTVFYSTHMLADAEEICDQFGILHQGEMKFVGTPSACIESYGARNLEEAYIKCISSP